ncbi:MAG: hypothetical protein RIR26_1586, partial [Pseudomonadota bacterium]
ILVKAKRRLMRLPPDSEQKGVLMGLIFRYEALLQRSHAGEDCDEEMENVESLLESEFEA